MNEGNVSQNPSFILSLTPKPNSINKANPPEEINKIKLNFKPVSIPIPPRTSRIPVSLVNFSNLKRLNSSCI